MNIFSFFTKNSKTKNVSFETQLKVFEDLGFKLNEGISGKDLLNIYGRDIFEEEPFVYLYIILGDLIDKKSKLLPITNQAYHLDTESEYAYVDYKTILENIKRISSGELDFQNIGDYFYIDEDDEAKGEAFVYFELNGDSYKWDLEVEGDWIDVSLFSKIAKLTNKYKTSGKLTYFDTGGQDIVLGWATKTQLKRIRNKTGLDIVFLK